MSADAVAALVHEQYVRLPKTGKPQPGEWTVLSGVVLVRPSAEPEVVALGTGTKCLTASQIAADEAGEMLHDSHAEVCARRALVSYLMAELHTLLHGAESAVLEPRTVDAAGLVGGFALRPGVEMHFYTSEPPCGDAAIFALAVDGTDGGEPQDEAVDPSASLPPAPKRPRSTQCSEAAGVAAGLQRRTGARPASASAMAAEEASGGTECGLGLVRTKPGRGERTCCMSCSDKLSRWTALGVQGSLLSLLIPEPICFKSITVSSPCSLAALRRALSRSQPFTDCHATFTHANPVGDRLRREEGPPCEQHAPAEAPPQLRRTSVRFCDGPPASSAAQTATALPDQPSTSPTADGLSRPCSNSLVWAACGLSEAVNGLSGKKLGANKRMPSPKHRSATCKAVRLARFLELLRSLPDEAIAPELIKVMRTAMAHKEEAHAATPASDRDGSAEANRVDASGSHAQVDVCGTDSLCPTYASLKAASLSYQQRKAALLQEGRPLADWLKAPASCERFWITAHAPQK